MDLSLQSRNLSSTSNSTSKCNMAKDEMECGLHRISQSQPSLSNFAVTSAPLQSEAANATNDTDRHHHQQHQPLPQNHRGTISMPTPAPPSLERLADTSASSVSEDTTATYTNLNAKEAIRLQTPPPKSTKNILQNGNSNCHDGVNTAIYSHEAENLIDTSHIKHASHYVGVSDIKVKSIVNTVDMSSTNEHSSNSPHHYHHQHFIRQQGRYVLPASSQNLTVSKNLTPQQHSTNQQSHRPLRSSIPTVDISSNQMMEQARLISRQIELHERNELGMQPREQNKASHYFPQSLYQHLNTEQNIQKCLALPIQHDLLPSLVAINDNRDNEQYQRNTKAYVRPPSPPMINAYKFPSKLDPLLPLNILTSDVLESLSSNEDVVDLMKPSRKDKRIKKQFLEKFMCLSPKDGNNQQKKLEFQEGKNNPYEKDASQNQINSPIYTKGNVSLKDNNLKDAMSASYANLTYNVENEKHHFVQQKRKLSECRVITNAPSTLHENPFHSVTDNCNVNVKMSETKLAENVVTSKNHTIDENTSAPLESLTTVSPKFSKFKKQTSILRHNAFNSDSSDNVQNEGDPAMHNENGINAEDLRIHYKCNDEIRPENNMLPRGVHTDIDNVKCPSNLNNIYNSINNTPTNAKTNAISKNESDAYKSESDVIEVNETTADVLIGIVESSTKSPSKITTTLDAITHVDVESLKTQDKSSFEEVENKLEEMFAGIEDEPILRPQVMHNDVQLQMQADTSKLFENIESTMCTSSVKDSIKYSKHTSKEVQEPLTSTSVLILSHNDNKDKQVRVQEDSFKTKAAKKSLESDDINILHNVTAEGKEEEPPLDLYSPNRQTQTKTNLSVYGNCLDNKTNDLVNCDEDDNIYTTASISNMCSGSSSGIVKKDAKTTASRRKRIKSNRSKMDSAKKMQGTKVSPFHMNLKISDQGKTSYRSRRNASCKTFICDEGDQQQQQNFNNEKLARDFDVKLRSPFIMIKKDGSITIVNTTTATEDVNEKQAKIKKASSQGHRNVRGLHSSTLGNNYDAYTADSSWICVFCKLGPHKMGLGDLFGPYMATVNCEEYTNALNTVSNKLDSTPEFNYKHTHTHKINTKVRDCSLMLSTNSNDYYYPANETEMKRRKRPASGLFSHHDNINALRAATNLDNITPDIFLGMCKTSDGNYEIWLHEDCAIWAPDILLIGSQLVGITNAVWNSLSALCVCCYKPGATVCCLQRNCKQSAHLPCARQAQWSFDESTFWVFCPKHNNIKRHTNSLLLNPHAT